MQVSLRPIQEEVVVEGEIDLDKLNEEITELVHLTPVQIQAIISQLRSDLYQVKVDQSTDATFVCSRCLTEYKQPLIASWTERFSKDEREESKGYRLIEDQKVDLDPMIREALLLKFPYVPICKEDCKGLCPECGGNRNLQSCNCSSKRIDPRLEKLQEWLGDG